MKTFLKYLHKLSHSLGFNEGTIESWTDDEGYCWVAFKCNTCGERLDLIRSARSGLEKFRIKENQE